MLTRLSLGRFLVVSLVVLVLGFGFSAFGQAAAPAPAPDASKAPPAAAPAAPAPGAAAPGAGLGLGRREAAMSPEAANKTWELEATAVARQLKLNDAKTEKLVKAYKDARGSYRTALEAKIGAGTRPERENFAAMREVAESERGKFEASLKESLSADEAKKAVASLGSFSRTWDRWAHVLVEMKLDPKVEAQAMDATVGYFTEMSGAFSAEPGDREAMRAKMQQAREKLDADMAKILTADQLAKWKEATARRGRRG